jgi:hypothetical protein
MKVALKLFSNIPLNAKIIEKNHYIYVKNIPTSLEERHSKTVTALFRAFTTSMTLSSLEALSTKWPILPNGI